MGMLRKAFRKSHPGSQAPRAGLGGQGNVSGKRKGTQGRHFPHTAHKHPGTGAASSFQRQGRSGDPVDVPEGSSAWQCHTAIPFLTQAVFSRRKQPGRSQRIGKARMVFSLKDNGANVSFERRAKWQSLTNTEEPRIALRKGFERKAVCHPRSGNRGRERRMCSSLSL